MPKHIYPTAVLIASDDAPHIRAWLLRRGHLPAMVEVTARGRTTAP